VTEPRADWTDDPPSSNTLEAWERHLQALKNSLSNTLGREAAVELAGQMIEHKRRSDL
jgi:hypothetical protein